MSGEIACGVRVRIKAERLRGYYRRFTGVVGEVYLAAYGGQMYYVRFPVKQAGRWYRQDETALRLEPDWLEVVS